MKINIQQAIPCGLIVNEIITNSVKYAFRDMNKGEISLAIRYDDNNVYLEIGDNGVGLPEGFIIENANSLGLQLVVALVDQLDGTLEIKSENGTLFKIVFPVDKKVKQI